MRYGNTGDSNAHKKGECLERGAYASTRRPFTPAMLEIDFGDGANLLGKEVISQYAVGCGGAWGVADFFWRVVGVLKAGAVVRWGVGKRLEAASTLRNYDGD